MDKENETSEAVESAHDEPIRERLFKVTVHYPPAAKPFKDEKVAPSETVGHLKKRVLSFFGLVEGQTPDGGTATYTLYDHKEPLDELGRLLGEVADGRKSLELKLGQRIVQG